MTLTRLRRAAVAAGLLFALNAQATTIDEAVAQQRNAWREAQTQRLAQRDDRDSLIAAVLLGMPGDGVAAAANQAAARQRLKGRHGGDVLAAFVLAWSCRQETDCDSRADVEALTKLAPGNAVSWLLQPGGAAPDAATLHAAAQAGDADSQLQATLRIVRDALSAAAALEVPGVDAAALAQALRRDAAGHVPLPKLHPVGALCKKPTPEQREDCASLGRRLMADRSGSILYLVEGSVMVQRNAPGTPEAAAAKALWRDYLWMDERLRDAAPAERERMQAETVAVGEWKAWQQAAQRRSGQSAPPAGWSPADPSQLLLPEERAK